MKAKAYLMVLACSFLIGPMYAQLGGALKNAKGKVESTTGTEVPDASVTQPDAAIFNVENNLKSITETYYANYKSKGVDYLNNDGQLWFIRKSLEAARHYYTCGKEGYHGKGVVCQAGPAQLDPRYVALEDKFADAEAKVKEMEAAKGYEFVECKDNNIIFKESKTGKVLSADDSSHI